MRCSGTDRRSRRSGTRPISTSSKKFVEYCDHFGFDVLHTLGSVWDFGMSTFCDRSVVKSAENWDVTIADEKAEDALHRTVTIRTPGGDLSFSENYRRSSTYLIVSAPEEHLIKTKADFDFSGNSPARGRHGLQPDPEGAAGRGRQRACGRQYGRRVYLFGRFPKLDQAYVDPVEDEGFYREMMEYLSNARSAATGRWWRPGQT